jgi:aminomethyltransferase
LLWAKGVAHYSEFDVEIREPDVSPIQIQGPKSPDLMQAVFGSAIDKLGFYHFLETTLEGVPMLVARTGWSGEVGYEIFLRDGSKGGWLWDRLFAAGRPFGVMPGAPNNIRRMEAGFLSWGSDMDSNTNPFEMGLGKFVELDSESDFIGKGALSKIAAVGPTRRLIGLFIEGDPIVQGPLRRWPVTASGGAIGFVTSATWTPGMKRNIAFAILESHFSAEGQEVYVVTPDGERTASTTAIPFVDPRYLD